MRLFAPDGWLKSEQTHQRRKVERHVFAGGGIEWRSVLVDGAVAVEKAREKCAHDGQWRFADHLGDADGCVLRSGRREPAERREVLYETLIERRDVFRAAARIGRDRVDVDAVAREHRFDAVQHVVGPREPAQTQFVAVPTAERSVAEREAGEPGRFLVQFEIADRPVFRPGPIRVGLLRPENHVAGLQFVGADLRQFRAAKRHERMPLAGLHLDALAHANDDLMLCGDVELPNVRGLRKAGGAGRRVHRKRPHVEVADVVRNSVPLRRADASVRGRAREQYFDRFNTTEGRPDARVAGNATPTALLDECHRFDAVENAVDRVRDGQHETGGEHRERTAGVDEARGVRHEVASRQHVVEGVAHAGNDRFGVASEFVGVGPLRLGDRRGDSPQEFGRRLERAVVLLGKVALFEDAHRVAVEGRFGQVVREGGGLGSLGHSRNLHRNTHDWGDVDRTPVRKNGLAGDA